MKNGFYAIAATLLLVTAPASANDLLTINGSNDFGIQKQRILADLNEGKRYAEIRSEDRDKVKSALDRMDKMLSTNAGIDSLGEREKVALFNEQELVNTVLTQAGEDSRLVCERQKKTGSHRAESVCKTVAQRRRERDASQDYLRDRPTVRPLREGI
ncbi:hypothetical protein BH23PSE2_BH23PSE2_09180 [soil metagenome]